MKHIVKTEKEWHDLRSQFVTASAAATLVGADPYSSPSKLRNPEPFFGNSYTAVGQLLEPLVVQMVNKKLGTHFELYETEKDVKEFYTRGRLGATPDAHEDRKILLECKTVNSRTYLKYSAVPPNKYLVQLLTQAYCAEMKGDYHYLALMNTGLRSETDYSNFLKNPEIEQNWPITIYQVWKNEKLCDIINIQAEKFVTNEKFRVDTKIKKLTNLMLNACYRRIE